MGLDLGARPWGLVVRDNVLFAVVASQSSRSADEAVQPEHALERNDLSSDESMGEQLDAVDESGAYGQLQLLL